MKMKLRMKINNTKIKNNARYLVVLLEVKNLKYPKDLNQRKENNKQKNNKLDNKKSNK